MKKIILFVAVFLILSSRSALLQADGIGSVSSVSAVLYEPQSRSILYEKDAYTARPIASTTKIMTALLAVELCPPRQIITVPPEAVRVEGSTLGLRGGDKITMLDLVTGLLLASGNDAANAVAYAVAGDLPSFAKLMNERAEKIGMKDTKFVTPSGLDESGHSSTAYDMALLAAEAMNNKTIADICKKKYAVISFGNPPRNITVTNHNKLLKIYPPAKGIKTGFTKKSGRCLVSAAEKDGVQLIAVTLKAGDDWNDHIALHEYGFSATESILPTLPKLPPVAIMGGEKAHINLIAQAPPACTVLKEEKEKIQVDIRLPRFVIAPVKAGDAIGTIIYKAGGRNLCTLTLTSGDDVDARPVAGFRARATRNFSSLLAEWLRL
ncbi:MAG: D-alanyl-D-alanine carboxypeptidase [Oscillospiraceae bacterium]|nr:D-alanyl-D-alanine carboxypeptidase [Oscillospiraceae bacterium]